MKLNKFLLAALAAASLTACSDSTDVEKGNGAQWNSDGTGYVSLSLNLPTTKSTGMRANDQFEDGTADEYKVNDVMLILFQGANEADANFVAAYKLSNVFDKESTSDNNITATSKLTRKIKAIDNTTSKLYAYVAINSNGVLSTGNTGADDIENTSLTIGTSTTAFSGNFTKFLQQTTENGKNSANFLMGNAPLADASGDVHTLSTIDSSMIKNSAAEAAKAPAAEVYVERAVAKVTLQNTAPKNTIENITASATAPKWTIEGWTLDNTRTNTQIVRNVQGFSTWNAYTTNAGRFKGTTAVDAASKYFRTYWAYDGANSQYTLWNDAAATNPFNRVAETEVTGNISNPQYCFENTFDVANMTYKNTTRALVKVHIGETTDATDKFMYNEDYATYANLSNINSILATKIKGLTAVEAVNTSNADIEDITFNYYAHKNDAATVTAESDAKYYALKSFKLNSKVYSEASTDTNEKALFELVRDYFGRISIYRGGNCYYQILIKHFGDDLTPWSGNNTENTPTTGNIYPGGDAAFLGRYGVLRNNWYNLNITGINKIGTPDVTVPDNTPDDNLDSYISVKINVLSWAKRQQNVTLQ